MWKNHYKKAVTFSFDDGIMQDIKLIELLDKYNLKATFHINSGLAKKGTSFQIDHVQVDHILLKDIPSVYQNHEVAMHSYTHPNMTELSTEDIFYQIDKDQKTLEKIMGYQPIGFAYPYGLYNQEIIDILGKQLIAYARTIESTYLFDFPKNTLTFHPTADIHDPKLKELIKQFLSKESQADTLLSIWGHSYEFDQFQSWDYLEEILKLLSHHQDVYYGTLREVIIDHHHD